MALTSAHQHGPDDVYGYVTPAYTARVAQVAVAAAASLAPATPPPASFTAQRPSSGSVKVSWAAPSSGAAVDHYVVSARRTSESTTWPSQAGRATTSRLPPSMRKGTSLFAYPEYRCSTSSRSIPSGSTNVTQTR